jgi:hypothetical protein
MPFTKFPLKVGFIGIPGLYIVLRKLQLINNAVRQVQNTFVCSSPGFCFSKRSGGTIVLVVNIPEFDHKNVYFSFQGYTKYFQAQSAADD